MIKKWWSNNISIFVNFQVNNFSVLDSSWKKNNTYSYICCLTMKLTLLNYQFYTFVSYFTNNRKCIVYTCGKRNNKTTEKQKAFIKWAKAIRPIVSHTAMLCYATIKKRHEKYCFNILASSVCLSVCLYLCLTGCRSLTSQELQEIFEKF